MKYETYYSNPSTAKALFYLFIALTLGGCAFVHKPVSADAYDFGPEPSVKTPASAAAELPSLALAEVDTSQALDGHGMLYRLDYADAQQLRPYAHARWSAPPAQLVRQRLREVLGQQRTVVDADTSTVPLLLRIHLQEFSQQFASPTQSSGVIRLLATLSRMTPAGELPVAQRTVEVRRPAPSADASGGVQALTAATDAAAQELARWLAPLR
jgi:cholesterol transport system auxiliary component